MGGDKKLNVNKTFDSNQSITKIEVIVDSVKGDSHEIQIKPDGRDIGLQFPLQSGTNIFDKVTHFADKDVYINTNGEISINAWNCSISEIKFYTTSSDTVTIPTEYTLSSEPILSAGNAYYTIENVGSNTNGAFTTPPIELGSANANKKITKIKYFISNNNGAGLQLKVYNDDGSVKKDIQKDNINNELSEKIKEWYSLHENRDSCLFCGNTDITTAINKWKKIFSYYIEI